MTNDAFSMLGGAALAGLQPISCVIYTADTCISGVVRTAAQRFSDAFNAFTERMVEVQDATIQTVVEGQPKVEAAATAFVRLGDIIFCYPAEAEPMRPAVDVTVRRERQRRQVVLLLNGRSVTGEAHLAAGSTLAHYANARSETFLALTSATITRYGSSITLPFVLVNTGMVSSLYAVGDGLDQRTTVAPAHAVERPAAAAPSPEPIREESVSVTEALRNAVLHATSGPAPAAGGGNGALSRWLERRTGQDRREANWGPPPPLDERRFDDHRRAS